MILAVAVAGWRVVFIYIYAFNASKKSLREDPFINDKRELLVLTLKSADTAVSDI